MRTIEEMTKLVDDGIAKPLTIEAAKSLKGRRIQTIYFGYAGQDDTDEFVVGEIVSELEYYRNLKEDCFPDKHGHMNRAEYWESYMTPAQLAERSVPILFTNDGRRTYMYCHNGVFCCSDDDRWRRFLSLLSIFLCFFFRSIPCGFRTAIRRSRAWRGLRQAHSVRGLRGWPPLASC